MNKTIKKVKTPISKLVEEERKLCLKKSENRKLSDKDKNKLYKVRNEMGEMGFEYNPCDNYRKADKTIKDYKKNKSEPKVKIKKRPEIDERVKEINKLVKEEKKYCIKLSKQKKPKRDDMARLTDVQLDFYKYGSEPKGCNIYTKNKK